MVYILENKRFSKFLDWALKLVSCVHLVIYECVLSEEKLAKSKSYGIASH
jgi:hypothetical protein